MEEEAFVSFRESDMKSTAIGHDSEEPATKFGPHRSIKCISVKVV